jgi:hypothetical protein
VSDLVTPIVKQIGERISIINHGAHGQVHEAVYAADDIPALVASLQIAYKEYQDDLDEQQALEHAKQLAEKGYPAGY